MFLLTNNWSDKLTSILIRYLQAHRLSRTELQYSETDCDLAEHLTGKWHGHSDCGAGNVTVAYAGAVAAYDGGAGQTQVTSHTS